MRRWSRGTEIDALDSMIAGTALSEKRPVITANAKHFRRVDSLEVITY
ncbi:MAG: type II toxin-antitoxin system VapC family toxin [Candidatus Micrarchaeota archaeon]